MSRFNFQPMQATAFNSLLSASYVWKQLTSSSPQRQLLAGDIVLEERDPKFDLSEQLNRMTPVGLSEHDLLIAINRGNVRSLQRFTNIGPKIAENILIFKKNDRYLTSIDELVRIPLIGAVRFRKLCGRRSLFFRKRLHTLLRVPLDCDIKVNDLRPVTWSAPGLPRLFLASVEEVASERQLGLENGHYLKVRRIGDYRLCFHFSQPIPSGWASYLLKNLPRSLRKLIHERSPA
ncbi:helix-hairpin-helix domain-containing protein [Rubellicoccus peritrichatus]|uniref:Helix-hairpin-helix domain-containing protein n=1 Tax=Rubellicoccus peritrichatus TaxID=3080537 RepID=A0AAQ3QVZ3_9BACT|nr:helix-hairpin-helix domain-containing protein [Puniceicoccus sp. CR14]WOO41372.1 helix-hairpin-helix domain-containing protein [Puniceicoccus sp. CR14]